MKKFINIFVIALALVTAFWFGATKAEAAVTENGTCGDNLTWTLDDQGTLVISGTGEMTEFKSADGEYWGPYGSKIKTVIIEDGVTSILEYAFYYCTDIQSVTIGNSVTTIGGCAFGGCTGLKSLIIPDSVKTIGAMAFWECTGLETVVLGNGVNEIGENAFWDCTGLKAIELPDSLVTIERCAFHNCTSLTKLTIPKSVTSLGKYLFLGCTGLKEIYVEPANPNYSSDARGVIFNKDKTELVQAYHALLGAYEIPDGVITISEYAFEGCVNLTAVTIPESVKTIGTAAFYGCADLTEFKFNAVNMNDLNRSNYVFGEAAQNGDGLKVTIGKQVTRIPAYLFDPFSSSSFALKLASLEFEEGSACESIGRYAFQFCTGLESVELPAGVTYIDSFAFNGCEDLSNLTIPNSVNTVEWGAFYGTDLQTVTFCGTEEQWENIAIWGQNDGLYSATVNYHNYENGSCRICGEVDANATTLFDIDVARMILGNSLEFQFGVAKSKFTDTTGFYAEIKKGDVTKIVPAESWGTAGQYWAIVYDGLAAKEMADEISVTIYNGDGDAVTNPKIDSVRAYVARAFADQTDKGKTMLVDMLNYGAAAQVSFDYNTGDLANSQLTDAQKAYATAKAPAISNKLVTGTNYKGTRLVLESRIQMQVAFTGMNRSMYAVYSYTDHNGKAQTVTVNGEDFIEVNGIFGIELSQLVYADARTMVTIQIYNSKDKLLSTVKDSMESYASRTSTDAALIEALMKFADSAKEYLHQ